MLTFRCASCKKKITTEDSLAGQQGECPFCGKVVVAPGTAPSPVPVSSQAGEGLRDYPRCPKCGARRKEGDRRCAFCGESIPETGKVAPKTTRKVVAAPAQEGPDRRKLLLGAAVVALAVVVVGVVYFSGGDETPSFPPDEDCRRRMLGLNFLSQEYGASEGHQPKVTGMQFWKTIGTKRPLGTLLNCPGEGKSVSDYRGPGKLYDELQGGDPILVDNPGNHPGGINMMTKGGNLEWVPEGSDRYKALLAETKD